MNYIIPKTKNESCLSAGLFFSPNVHGVHKMCMESVHLRVHGCMLFVQHVHIECI